MRYLLDTHAVIWMLQDEKFFPARTRQLIADPANVCSVSLATPWEMAIKIALGKLHVPYQPGEEFRALLSANNIGLLAPQPADFDLLCDLPHHHGDPFDRMLAVQALRHDLVLISRDSVFDEYAVKRLWS